MPKGKSTAPAKAKAKAAAKKTDVITRVESSENDIEHVVTEEDLKTNPELAEQGVKVGETIVIPKDAIVEAPEETLEETEESEEETEEETEEGEEEESSEDEASVYKENGEFVRAYSKSVHGKDFKKLAKEFAGKIGGQVK